ncbi:S-protein homolog 6-like [Carica papaya]|uniref:S-protein homolog 6-like n=1 Tax=Carica papaya TaxID=3649 RepID=UPI000B8C942E|nr:S-protein homolog 6-like [Carica papaya]
MKKNNRNSTRFKQMIMVVWVMMMGNMVFVVKSWPWLPQPFKKYHVNITNQLANNKVLDVHCKSADDDLHPHSLAGGRSYQFGFRINYVTTTLFWCNFWYDNYRHHAVFNVFDAEAKFVYLQCRDYWCNWESRDDGFYLFDGETKSFKLTHKWDEKHI